ncbi:glycosyltransferase family 2 protein [Roseovarius sp. A21]|uniref:Glycosyltransferase family 2 protein n=2 Tax=Roseovarius bejariae TaxID=2576383 RepID=A0A844CY23_9RHOB|nr:glycosyltransferase family 2 protein [Roseovarius bejariae]
MKAPFLSICIPTYDMGGNGAQFLEQSLTKLTHQSYQNFDVVVSDQSDGNDVAQTCNAFSERLNIKHLFFSDGPRQASANTNNAMRHAQGEVVKILFQDDILARHDSLELTAQAFEEDAVWVICGSAVTYDDHNAIRPMVPQMHPQIRFGKNTISSPSVLSMRRGKALEFDEHLIWLMDVEIYHRLNKTYGSPKIIPETLVLNRLHERQVSNTGVTVELRRKELSYVRQKHKMGETLKDRVSFYKQILKAR